MHTALYSPEDNKLRIYPANRLDDELGEEGYKEFKAAGYKWASKQECFVCARWTPTAEDWALDLCGEIGDEDYSPEERSADRAERFTGYREKRRGEAHGSADSFESGPAVFGHQNRARAERQARRHDRHRGHALSQWSKAEYWQQRTAGVISHALFKSSPHVRRGRLLRLEKELRHHSEKMERYRKSYEDWKSSEEATTDTEKAARLVKSFANMDRWTAHYDNRINYEKAMLEAEGGRVTETDIEPAGWIQPGSRNAWRLRNVGDRWLQIAKVNKSNATGRVVSVLVEASTVGDDGKVKNSLVLVNVERLGADSYRAPTNEERAAFATTKKANKKPPVSLINPTDEDAERLQCVLNDRAADNARQHGKAPAKPREIERVPFAKYSRFKGESSIYYVSEKQLGGVTFKVRMRRGGFYDYSSADHVVVLTDKPQKPLPLDWESLLPAEEPATKTQATLFAEAS